MTNDKSWFESKTIWGALLAFAAAVAGSFGVSVDQNLERAIADSLIQLAGAAGALLAIYGRFAAVDTID